MRNVYITLVNQPDYVLPADAESAAAFKSDAELLSMPYRHIEVGDDLAILLLSFDPIEPPHITAAVDLVTAFMSVPLALGET